VVLWAITWFAIRNRREAQLDPSDLS
jgi:hypothetical protein